MRPFSIIYEIRMPKLLKTALLVFGLIAVPIFLVYMCSFRYSGNRNELQKVKDLSVHVSTTVKPTVDKNLPVKNSTEEIKKAKEIIHHTDSELKLIEEAKKCYKSNETATNLQILEDILKSKRKPRPGNTIFFHDTSCTIDGRVTFTSRQACAVESAAKWNPTRDIFVLFAAPVGFVPSEQPSPIISALKNYSNIYFRSVDWYEYAKGTPAEEWIKKDLIFLSTFAKPHLSDLMRLLTLHRFGGIHIDLDFVVQKKFDELPQNFVGEERSDWYNNAVMGFQPQNAGHRIVDMILRENINSYKPECWACGGPDAVTRVLKNICHANHTVDMTPDRCWGLKILMRPVFFPINYPYWREFFDTNPKVVENTLKLTEHSAAVHMWNSRSAREKIDTTKEQKCAYQIMAEKNCPRVLQAAGQFF